MEKKYYLFKMNSTTIYGVTAILTALMIFVFYLIYGNDTITVLKDNYSLSLILFIPYLLLHEALHATSYVIHGASFKNITFGAHIEKGVLCCLCKQNITKKNIMISLLYPFFFIGVITLIIGLLVNSPVLIILSLINISGCSGDLVMTYALIKIPDFEYSEYDDPTSFGLYSKDDLSKRKMFGLDFVGTKDKLDIKDLRKFDISKVSWFIPIFVLIYIIVMILDKFLG